MSRTSLGVVLAAVCLLHTVPSEAQQADPSTTFKSGPVNVTVFDGTGVADAQFTVDLVQGENVEVLSVPVDVNVPGHQRSLLIVEFVGHFFLPTEAPVTISLDCLVDHQLNLPHGCGITPTADFDFTNATPIAGGASAVIPATFLIRDLPEGTHQIGIAVHLSSRTTLQVPNNAELLKASSSLVVSLFAKR